MLNLLRVLLLGLLVGLPAPSWAGSMTLLGVGKPPSGAASPTVTYIGFTTPTVTSLSATSTGAPIGIAAADRVVGVVVQVTAGNIASVAITIGASTATPGVSASVNGSFSAIAYLPVASGTTANINATFTGALGDGAKILLEVYNLNGLSSNTPTGTGQNSSSSATTLTTGNFSTTSGGVAIIGSSQFATGSTTDIITGTTGTITADHANYAIDGFSCTTTASAIALATNASTNFTATWNAAQASTIAAAAWR